MDSKCTKMVTDLECTKRYVCQIAKNEKNKSPFLSKNLTFGIEKRSILHTKIKEMAQEISQTLNGSKINADLPRHKKLFKNQFQKGIKNKSLKSFTVQSRSSGTARVNWLKKS